MAILGRLIIDEEVWSSNQVLMQKYDIKTGWGESRSRPKMNLQKNGNYNR